MDDIERPLVVEQDGAPVRRPAPPVLEERQAPWGDPPHAGAIEIDDEERHVRVGGAARIDAAEDEPLAVGRVVARDVVATRIGRDPAQAAAVGCPDGVDAVAARVGHAEALAGESRAVRRPAAPTGGFEGGIGPLELAEGSGVGIYDRRRAVLFAVGAGGEDRDLAAVRRPAWAPREPSKELLQVAAVRVRRVSDRVVIPVAAAERDPAVRAGDLRLGGRRRERHAGTQRDSDEPFHQVPHWMLLPVRQGGPGSWLVGPCPYTTPSAVRWLGPVRSFGPPAGRNIRGGFKTWLRLATVLDPVERCTLPWGYRRSAPPGGAPDRD